MSSSVTGSDLVCDILSYTAGFIPSLHELHVAYDELFNNPDLAPGVLLAYENFLTLYVTTIGNAKTLAWDVEEVAKEFALIHGAARRNEEAGGIEFARNITRTVNRISLLELISAVFALMCVESDIAGNDEPWNGLVGTIKFHTDKP